MNAVRKRRIVAAAVRIAAKGGRAALVLSVLVYFVCGTAGAFFGYKDKKSMETILHRKLGGQLKSAPFFSAGPGSKGDSKTLIYATTRYDPVQQGAVTAVEIVDFEGRPTENSPVSGIEVRSGYQVSGIDLDGDGAREIALLDTGGRLRLLDGKGSPLSDGANVARGIGTVVCPPVVSDVDGDGKNELLLSVEDLDDDESVVRLVVCGASGKVSKTIDMGGKPATPLAVARLGEDQRATVAFVREDGMVALLDAIEETAFPAGRIDSGRVGDADLCAFDGGFAFVDGGEKLKTIGKDERNNVAVKEHVPGTEGASFVKVAAGENPDGRTLFCLYDEEGGRFVLFSPGDAATKVLHVEEPGKKWTVRLSVARIDGEKRPYFVATLFQPGGSRLNDGIHGVFAKHASESMKKDAIRYEKERFERYKALESIPEEVASHLEEAVREYKLALMIDHMGQGEAEAMAFGRMQTEILLFDSTGHLLDGFPVRIRDLHPFADRKGIKSFRVDLRRESAGGRIRCLVGLNGEGAQPGEIFLFRSP